MKKIKAKPFGAKLLKLHLSLTMLSQRFYFSVFASVPQGGISIGMASRLGGTAKTFRRQKDGGQKNVCGLLVAPQ